MNVNRLAGERKTENEATRPVLIVRIIFNHFAGFDGLLLPLHQSCCHLLNRHPNLNLRVVAIPVLAPVNFVIRVIRAGRAD